MPQFLSHTELLIIIAVAFFFRSYFSPFCYNSRSLQKDPFQSSTDDLLRHPPTSSSAVARLGDSDSTANADSDNELEECEHEPDTKKELTGSVVLMMRFDVLS